MAIVKNLPGFEVAIVANGKPLTEYINNSEPDQDRKTTRYIEAISDQVFEVQVTARRGAENKGDGLGAYIYVDGQRVARPLLLKSNFSSKDYVTARKGARITTDTYKEFRFASIESGMSFQCSLRRRLQANPSLQREMDERSTGRVRS